MKILKGGTLLYLVFACITETALACDLKTKAAFLRNCVLPENLLKHTELHC